MTTMTTQLPARNVPTRAELARFTEYSSLVAHLQTPAGGAMSRGRAVNFANTHRPDLRTKYTGRGGAAPVASTASSSGYAGFTDYLSLVAHLQSEAGGGLAKGPAVKKANEVRPDLREKYARRG